MSITCFNRFDYFHLQINVAESSDQKIIARSAQIKDELEPLFLAAKMGNCEKISELLSEGSCSVHDHNKLKGQTPLHLAAEFNQVDAIRLLVNQGASINFDAKAQLNDAKTFDDSGAFRQLPIHCAAKAGATDAITVLAELGSKLEEKEADGYTPLHLAAKNGHLECVIALCDLKVNINPTNELANSSDKGRTPLHLAVIGNRTDVALELIRRGADYLAKDSNGITPFFWASRIGLIDVVTEITRLIKEKNQKLAPNESINNSNHTSVSSNTAVLDAVNKVDEDGNTELHRAARTGALQTIIELHKLGANLDERNRAGETPLYVACDIEAIKKTIKRKQDQDSLKLDTRQAPIVEELLKLGANRHLAGARNNTPLHLVTITSSNQLVKLLCEGNNNVNSINDSDQTALHIAASDKNSPAVSLILKAGGNAHAQDDDLNTPLHLVLKKEDDDEFDEDDLDFTERCVDLLLAAGSRVKKPNENNETALELAEENFGDDSRIYEKIKKAADAEHEQLEVDSPDSPNPAEQIKLAIRAPSPELDEDTLRQLEELTKTLISEDDNLQPVITNQPDENFLQTLARDPSRTTEFDRFIQDLDPGTLQNLMRQKSLNQENALHYACRYHNYPLLKKFTDTFATEFLVQLARSQNQEGLNALQLLLLCGLDPKILDFKAAIEQKERNIPDLSRFQRNYLDRFQTHAMLAPMLELFKTKISHPDLVLADTIDNNALMLACYTNNVAILRCVVEILNTTDNIIQAVSQKPHNATLKPLQFICTFGNSQSIHFIFEKLGNRASELCVELSALDYCYKTQASDIEDFNTIIMHMQKFYGDQHNCFVKAMVKKGQPSPLVYSLHHEKKLPNILMSKKHVPCRYAVLVDTLEGRCVVNSPRYGFFAESKESDSARIELLQHLFRIHWPEKLIHQIAEVLQTYRSHKIIAHQDPKCFILNVLFEYFINIDTAPDEMAHSCIALAIFYQINEKDLNHRESDLLHNFGTQQYSEKILAGLGRFLQAQVSDAPAIKQKILSRIFRSKSIYLSLLLRCLPQLTVFEKGVEEKFISTIQSKAELSTQIQSGENHGNGIK